MQNPLWQTLFLFKCNVHNANTIAFSCKIVTSRDVITQDSVILGAAGKITDIRTSSNADEMDLYHQAWC